MSRKLPRLLFVASMVAGASLAPMTGAGAQDTRGIDISQNKFGANGTADAAGVTSAYKGDDIVWTVLDGEHTVTPVDPAKWDGNKGSPKLTPDGTNTWTFRFDLPGEYPYFCTIHGREAMSGMVKVIDPNPPAPPPPPPSSSSTTTTAAPTTTTRPVVTTTAPPATSAGSKTQTTAAPATTTTTAKNKDKAKDKKPKEEEETTTTTAPPPPIDLPNEAIVPSLPGYGSTGTTTQRGVEAPDGTPEGDAVALLKSGNGRGGNAKKLLLVSGVGLGVLGLGTAGYKYANRSSKYFPA